MSRAGSPGAASRNLFAWLQRGRVSATVCGCQRQPAGLRRGHEGRPALGNCDYQSIYHRRIDRERIILRRLGLGEFSRGYPATLPSPAISTSAAISAPARFRSVRRLCRTQSRRMQRHPTFIRSLLSSRRSRRESSLTLPAPLHPSRSPPFLGACLPQTARETSSRPHPLLSRASPRRRRLRRAPSRKYFGESLAPQISQLSRSQAIRHILERRAPLTPGFGWEEA